MLQSAEYQLKSFVIEYKIDTQYITNEYMREWLRYTAEIKRNKIKYKDKLIKKYFILKSKVLKKPKIEKWRESSDKEEYSDSDESE